MYNVTIADVSFSDFSKISSTCVTSEKNISLEMYTWHYQPKFSSEIKSYKNFM